MPSKFVPVEFRSAIVAVVFVLASVVPLQVRAQAVSLDPAKMPRIGTVDQRVASYNIEMAEATGGKFWQPDPSDRARAVGCGAGRHGSEHVSVSPANRSLESPSA